MLSWRIFTDPYSIATIVLPLAVLLWLCARALFAGRIGRGPRCGACKHETAVPPGDRCPECGMLYTDAGITTKRLRRVGAFPVLLVLAAWTAFAGAMAMRVEYTLWQRNRSAIYQAMSDGQHLLDWEQIDFNLRIPGKRYFTFGDSNEPDPFEMNLVGNIELLGGEAAPTTIKGKLQAHEGKPILFEIAFPSGSWTVSAPHTDAISSGGSHKEHLENLIRASGELNQSAELDEQLEQVEKVIEFLLRDPKLAMDTKFGQKKQLERVGPDAFGNGTWTSRGYSQGGSKMDIRLGLSHGQFGNWEEQPNQDLELQLHVRGLTFDGVSEDAEFYNITLERTAEWSTNVHRRGDRWLVRSEDPEFETKEFDSLSRDALVAFVDASSLNLDEIQIDDLFTVCEALNDRTDETLRGFFPDRYSKVENLPLTIDSSWGSSSGSRRNPAWSGEDVLLAEARRRSRFLGYGGSGAAWLAGAVLLFLARPRTPRVGEG